MTEVEYLKISKILERILKEKQKSGCVSNSYVSKMVQESSISQFSSGTIERYLLDSEFNVIIDFLESHKRLALLRMVIGGVISTQKEGYPIFWTSITRWVRKNIKPKESITCLGDLKQLYYEIEKKYFESHHQALFGSNCHKIPSLFLVGVNPDTERYYPAKHIIPDIQQVFFVLSNDKAEISNLFKLVRFGFDKKYLKDFNHGGRIEKFKMYTRTFMKYLPELYLINQRHKSRFYHANDGNIAYGIYKGMFVGIENALQAGRTISVDSPILFGSTKDIDEVLERFGGITQLNNTVNEYAQSYDIHLNLVPKRTDLVNPQIMLDFKFKSVPWKLAREFFVYGNIQGVKKLHGSKRLKPIVFTSKKQEITLDDSLCQKINKNYTGRYLCSYIRNQIFLWGRDALLTITKKHSKDKSISSYVLDVKCNNVDATSVETRDCVIEWLSSHFSSDELDNLIRWHKGGNKIKDHSMFSTKVTISLKSKQTHTIPDKPIIIPQDIDHTKEKKKRLSDAIDDVKEKETPPSEGIVFKAGKSYLIRDTDYHKALDAFLNLTKAGTKGYIISPMKPSKLKESHNMADVDIAWLTSISPDSSDNEEILRPERLQFEIARNINRFIKENRPGAVFLSGIEDLIQANGDSKVQNFVKKLLDISASKNATLVVCVSDKFNDGQVRGKFDKIS